MFNGTYEVQSDCLLLVDTQGSTYAGIPEGSKYLEFMGALDQTSSYELENERLHIYYDEGKRLLHFKAE